MDKQTENVIRRRIEWKISDIHRAIEAIEQDKEHMTLRGDDSPLSFAYIDLFFLNDALIVLQNCAPSFDKIPHWKKERDALSKHLEDVVQRKFNKDKQIFILKQALAHRITDFGNHVSVLPANISPDGDGFGNLLSKRHSIEALLNKLKLETGENPYYDIINKLDLLLKKGADQRWLLAETTCEKQLLELAPPSRWWFYRKNYELEASNR